MIEKRRMEFLPKEKYDKLDKKVRDKLLSYQRLYTKIVKKDGMIKRLKQRIKDESSMSHEPSRVSNLSRNLEQGSRRTFRGYGYSDEPLTDVSVPRSRKPLEFKNKIEEYIHIAKQKSH